MNRSRPPSASTASDSSVSRMAGVARVPPRRLRRDRRGVDSRRLLLVRVVDVLSETRRSSTSYRSSHSCRRSSSAPGRPGASHRRVPGYTSLRWPGRDPSPLPSPLELDPAENRPAREGVVPARLRFLHQRRQPSRVGTPLIAHHRLEEYAMKRFAFIGLCAVIAWAGAWTSGSRQ